ncbi:MAG: GYD family protein [Chloroflexi bacterium RBG_16_68_14]|nr:MAG: GYD family protein [Chloroflexi bacterium RBG_16_68_14]
MATYVLLTRLSPEALTGPESVGGLNRQVEDRIKQQCPAVRWLSNYALLGPYDYLDIFEAPDSDTASQVALLIRSFGHATTETWVATPWDRFVELAEGLKR